MAAIRPGCRQSRLVIFLPQRWLFYRSHSKRMLIAVEVNLHARMQRHVGGIRLLWRRIGWLNHVRKSRATEIGLWRAPGLREGRERPGIGPELDFHQKSVWQTSSKAVS